MNRQDQHINWNDTVRDLSPGLLSYFSAVFPRQIAADMVQEVFLRLVLKVRTDHFDQTKGSLRMYAYGIARLVRLEGRRTEMSPVSSIEPDTLPATGNEEAVDNRNQLRAAVRQLKATEQEVILLLLDKDLSLSEIGTILDMPAGTVKSHIHRAKSALKDIIQRSERMATR